MKKRYKFTTVRQVGGDDGYQWAIFVNGVERINGLTRREVSYYRDKFEHEEEEKLCSETSLRNSPERKDT